MVADSTNPQDPAEEEDLHKDLTPRQERAIKKVALWLILTVFCLSLTGCCSLPEKSEEFRALVHDWVLKGAAEEDARRVLEAKGFRLVEEVWENHRVWAGEVSVPPRRVSPLRDAMVDRSSGCQSWTRRHGARRSLSR